MTVPSVQKPRAPEKSPSSRYANEKNGILFWEASICILALASVNNCLGLDSTFYRTSGTSIGNCQRHSTLIQGRAVLIRAEQMLQQFLSETIYIRIPGGEARVEDTALHLCCCVPFRKEDLWLCVWVLTTCASEWWAEHCRLVKRRLEDPVCR